MANDLQPALGLHTTMSVNKLKPGTTVRIWCGAYWHYGLIDSTGSSVIHNSKEHGKVVRETIEAFSSGASLVVCADVMGDWPSKAARLAESAIGVAYRLWSQNCEHFVRWAHGLEPTSPQIEAALVATAGLTVAATAKHPAARAGGLATAIGAFLAGPNGSPLKTGAAYGLSAFALVALFTVGG